jgi:crotonobetainyl-CoA:carnitine CoA-transferase CaiB-like acyl-CoA transferase
MPAVPVADHAGAWAAALAVVAALHRRHESGRGAMIDASLYDAALHTNLVGWAEEAAAPRAVGSALPLSGSLACYNLYRTADGGTVAIACLEPRFWRRFCSVVERPDLVKLHLDTAPATRKRVQELVGSRSRDAWEALAAEHDLPIEPVLSAAEATDHPQARHRGLVTTGPDGLPRLGFPGRIDGLRPEAGERVPRIGDDTGALLAELGFELSPGERRAAGVGRRGGWKRALARWRIRRRGPKG